MELQLGLSLALPLHNPVNGFEKSELMGLETWRYGCSLESKNQVKNKRSFDVAFETINATAGINESKVESLLLWNGQPNEEDDEKGQKRRNSHCTITKNDNEGNRVVGWPPIKSWRRKTLYQHNDHDHHRDHHHLQINQILPHNKENDQNDGILSANSMYVKVKMEGVGIARKVDIRLHHSYQTLRDTLKTMFSKCKRCEKEGGAGAGADYILTYQDRHGDWLLAADVPWQTFIESVQRLRILRNGGLMTRT